MLLLHATFDPDGVRALRDTGFTTVLLEVSCGELQRRHRRRLDEEGWSNEDWADGNLAQIAELRRCPCSTTSSTQNALPSPFAIQTPPRFYALCVHEEWHEPYGASPALSR